MRGETTPDVGLTDADAAGRRRVVVVDLDHTLARTDTLHEQLARIVFDKPHLLPGLIAALFRGKAAVKDYCARYVTLDVGRLPICDEVVALLRVERERGSYLVLCTAADHRVADAVASAVGLFDEVLASRNGINLKGAAKADRLVERFPEGFVYAGDHAADLAVWGKAESIVLVATSPATATRAKALGKPVLAELRPRAGRPSKFRDWVMALRVHHWSKNVLIFLPLILAHAWTDVPLTASTFAGFVLLLAVTSSSYLINDLADIDADRRHATKRHRPIASARLPIAQVAIVATVTLPVALILSHLLNPVFGLALTVYLIITLAYSFGLKHIPVFDVFVIAILFTTRLVMGSAFFGSSLPIWLLTFSMFFFFSMAMAKRHTEVVQARDHDGDLSARGYQPGDWPLTLNLGISSSMGSLIILIFYLVDEAFRGVGYDRPEFLWPVVLCVAIWIGRVWLLTHRGQLTDDPVSFALRDRVSQGIALLSAICFVAAL